MESINILEEREWGVSTASGAPASWGKCVNVRTPDGQTVTIKEPREIPTKWPTTMKSLVAERLDKTLKSNEVFSESGHRKVLASVYDNRAVVIADPALIGWEPYAPDCKLTGQSLVNARAFLDERKPKPGLLENSKGWRFEDGTEVAFWIRDDGEAETKEAYKGSLWYTLPGPMPARKADPLVSALYDFRSSEYAKWSEPTWKDDSVSFKSVGQSFHYTYQGSWSEAMRNVVPVAMSEEEWKPFSGKKCLIRVTFEEMPKETRSVTVIENAWVSGPHILPTGPVVMSVDLREATTHGSVPIGFHRITFEEVTEQHKEKDQDG
jgi:hypothetical protein